MAGLGGKRPGAGRPKGRRSRKTVDREEKLAEARKRAEQDLANGELPERLAAMTPLDVMLYAMHIEALAGNWAGAASHAKEAAPYLHAKLTSTTVDATVRRSPTDFSDAELVAIAGADCCEEGVVETPVVTH